MCAYEIVEGSDVSSTALRDRPEPVAAPHDVVVEVRACSLTFRDVLVLSG